MVTAVVMLDWAIASDASEEVVDHIDAHLLATPCR